MAQVTSRQRGRPPSTVRMKRIEIFLRATIARELVDWHRFRGGACQKTDLGVLLGELVEAEIAAWKLSMQPRKPTSAFGGVRQHHRDFPELAARILELSDSNVPVAAIAERCKVSETMVRRILNDGAA